MDDDTSFCIYTPDTPSHPDFLGTMSLQTYESIPVIDHGPSADYTFRDYNNNNIEEPLSSAAPTHWTSMVPLVPYQFPDVAEPFQPSLFHPDVQFAGTVPPYQDTMSPLDTYNYFGPLAPNPEIGGSLPDFPLLYDATSYVPPVLPDAHSHFPLIQNPPPTHPMHSYETKSKLKNPEAMRNCWIKDLSRFVDQNKVLKVFSKHAKEKVATINTLKASAARRKVAARFKCSIEGCGADFTRKHNLENHLKSHCGVTDRSCERCGKSFTTVPVCKRHEKSCGKASSSSKIRTPKEFLDVVTAQSRT